MAPILNQSMPSQPISLRSILILYSHLCLGLARGLYPSGFLIKILCAFLISPVHATCPAHLILLYLISLMTFGKVCKLWSISLHSLFQPPAISSLLGLNIFLSTLFSNALNLFSSLTVKDQVSRPCKGKGKCKVLPVKAFHSSYKW
jgi:hypothetical protein